MNKKVLCIIYFSFIVLFVSASNNQLCQFLAAFKGYNPKKFYTLVRDIIDNTTTILDENNYTFSGGGSPDSFGNEMAVYNKTAYRLNAIIENLPVPLIRLLRSSTETCFGLVKRLMQDKNGQMLDALNIPACTRDIATIANIICRIADVSSLRALPEDKDSMDESSVDNPSEDNSIPNTIRGLYVLLSEIDHTKLGTVRTEI